MVNRGRSGGCITCKQRRVKCDEAKPDCSPCRRLGFDCGGYKTKYASLKFKDQNYRFCDAFDLGQTVKIPDRAAVPIPRSPSVPDTAVSFFLGHYITMGRDMESARGFFEILIPVYSSQRKDSALSLAVSVVASRILFMWRHVSGKARVLHNSYAQAVASIRSAIQDPIELGKPATSLAVLMLQLYENIDAVFGLRLATPIHHDGAVSLLPLADSSLTNGTISAYVRRFLFHTEISSAMRQKGHYTASRTHGLGVKI